MIRHSTSLVGNTDFFDLPIAQKKSHEHPNHRVPAVPLPILEALNAPLCCVTSKRWVL